MRTYKVLYVTGPLTDQEVTLSSPWYYQVVEVKFNKTGRFRILAVLK